MTPGGDEAIQKLDCPFRPPVVLSSLPPVDSSDAPSRLIGTHNGTFHCDEVLACSLLRLLPKFADAEILRSRDPKLLERCDVVVDVGAVFQPETLRFDHHQRGFEETFASLRPEMEWTMKLSSAGLVYVHFGEDLLQHLTKLPADSPQLKILFRKMYEDLLQEIDAIDNGVAVTEGATRYSISTGLSSRVGHLNSWWNENSSEEEQNRRFVKAMELAQGEFLDRLDFFRRCWLPARTVVASCLAERCDAHASGRLMVLSQGGVPWKAHLLALEAEQQLEGRILFVLYEDGQGSWRVQAVPADLSKPFENRRGLPEEWRGLREEKLAEASGVAGAIFVHAGGFIGGCRSFEGALAMAEKSLPAE